MILALFDFDGTISFRDSFIDFLAYAVGYPKFFLGLCALSKTLLKYRLGLIPNWQAKEATLKYFFSGWDLAAFRERARQYARERLPRIIRAAAREKIAWHQAQGHEVAVVSASSDFWLRDWCEAAGLALIATRLEVKDGKITGRLASKNCYGPEKVNRVREKYRLEDYARIYAYGNSRGDREMLALADHPEVIK